MQLVCPQCLARNRVPDERLDEGPLCGRCKTALLEPAPVELDDAKLPAFLAGTELPVVVDFWAAWCGPCRQMAPHFASAAQRLPRVRFAKLDTDRSPVSTGHYVIRSIPTLILFRDGLERARATGAMGAEQLVQWVTRAAA